MPHTTCGTTPAQAADLTASPRFRRDAQALHDLGGRAVAELLAEIVVEMDPQARGWLLGRLAIYRALTKEELAVGGGDGFAPCRFVVRQ
jgi:hypothetical protein